MIDHGTFFLVSLRVIAEMAPCKRHTEKTSCIPVHARFAARMSQCPTRFLSLGIRRGGVCVFNGVSAAKVDRPITNQPGRELVDLQR
jgi:hypothetical protein